MDKKEKLKILQKLSEDRLRKEVLIPLFGKMNFKDVIEYHGTVEKGKDIIFYETDNFGERVYTGVVVKKTNISGSASKSGSAMEVLIQIEQTFNEPYTDIYGLKELVIDRCIVITSREIKAQTIESIRGKLKKSNLDKLVRFFDGNKLVELLDTYMPGYFFKEIEYFNAYFNAVKQDFETIRDVSAIGQKEVLRLESIYVPLRMKETHQHEIPIEIEQEKDLKIFDEEIMEMEREAGEIGQRERVLELDTAVKNFHKLVMVGAPGAGKTTLLKHLALKYCKENIEKLERITVPVPVTLREFIQAGRSLRDYIDSIFEKYFFPEAKEFVEKDLKNGKCILLLDGFDELATRENQDQVSKEIQRFGKLYPRCQVLVTSRTAGYHDELAGFTCLELMEFDSQQVEQFIAKWFGESHPKKAASMLKVVKKNESISNLARNPLMIAIIAIIYEEDRELPQRRAALYQRAVEVLLSKWDIRKKLKNEFSSEKKEFILRKLALENHCQNRRTISEAAILEMIDQYAPQVQLKKQDAEPFLKEIWQRSYLLREIAMGTYDFLHLSFQEYFTALELTKQPDGIATLITHINKPWWEEPIRLYTGITQDADPLIKRIQKEVPEDIFYSNLMLAGKCIADAEFTEPELKEEIMQKLWALYQTGEFPLLKKRAMEVLALVKPRSIIESLIQQLSDEKRYNRKRAAEALGAFGSTEAIPLLIQAMNTDVDRDVRWRAAEALGAIGSTEAISALIRTMKSERDSNVRWSAASALRDIGSTDAIPVLIQTMKTDKDRYVRWRTAEVLGALGSTEIITLLIQKMRNDKDRSDRWRAAKALGTLGSTKAINVLIQAMKNDKDRYVRGIAAEALGAIGSTKAIPFLIQTMKNDKNHYVRGRAAGALGAIGSTESIPLLIQVLRKDKNSDVQGIAAEALGAIGSTESIPLLIQAMKTNKHPSFRWRTASALGVFGSTEAIPLLIHVLKNDQNNDVRVSTAEVLGKIGNETAIQPLKKALDDEDTGIYFRVKLKDMAFEALEKISKRLGVRILQTTEDR